MKIKIYETIKIDTLRGIRIRAKGENLLKDFSVELLINPKNEDILLVGTKSGKGLEKFLNDYQVTSIDVNIKKEAEAIQKFEFAKRIEEVIGKEIGFVFFNDGIVEWVLLEYPVIKQIELDESLTTVIITYHYLLEGGFGIMKRKEIEANWELKYSEPTWIR